MKTRIFFNRIPVVIILACLMVFATCKKDDDSETSYRVITAIDYSNYVLDGSTQLAYQGERLTLMSGYYNEARGDSTKTQYEYPDDNSIIGVDFEKAGGEWDKVGKTEYSFQDNELSQRIYYEFIDGTFIPSFKITVQYTNGNLTEELWSSYDEGTWVDEYKNTYTYDGDKVVQGLYSAKWTGSWEDYYKDVVTYNGDEIDFVLEYDYSDGSFVESYKYVFIYENKRIKQVNMFYKGGGVWTNDGASVFTYDANGNLESMSDSNAGNSYKTEFIYEKGKGNIDQIIYTGGALTNMVYPMPTKATSRASRETDKYLARKTQ